MVINVPPSLILFTYFLLSHLYRFYYISKAEGLRAWEGAMERGINGVRRAGRRPGGQADDMMRGDTRRERQREEGGEKKKKGMRDERGMCWGSVHALRTRWAYPWRFRGSIHDSGLVSSPERSWQMDSLERIERALTEQRPKEREG